MRIASATIDRPAPRTAPRQGTAMLPIVLVGSIGTIIEWYDFLIYGAAAALVFNTLFFPNFDPLTGRLAALGTYAVGFFARPFGGARFGHFGDRLGRKNMLMLTMFVMALGTFGIGQLPTYERIGIPVGFQLAAAIGGLSPVLAASLESHMGGTSGVSVLLIVLALITLTATLFVPESRHAPLDS